MDIATLRKVGEELYGARWQMPLARALVQPSGVIGVDISLMQRWVSGSRPLPKWIAAAVHQVIKEERQRHLELAARIELLFAFE